MFIALGVGAFYGARLRAAAFIAGALVPLGLVSLGHLLNEVWRDSSGPTDAPVMALLLAVYALAVPWLLGRLIVRGISAYGVATDTHKTINQLRP